MMYQVHFANDCIGSCKSNSHMIMTMTAPFWSMSTKIANKSFLPGSSLCFRTVLPGSSLCFRTYMYSLVCGISLSHNLCCSDKSHSYWSNLVLDLYNFLSFLCILLHTSWNIHPNHSKMSIRHHLSEISVVELELWFTDWSGFNHFRFISNLDIYPLISLSDFVSINILTLIQKIICQCEIKHMMLPIKTIMSLLKIMTYIFTVGLAAI